MKAESAKVHSLFELFEIFWKSVSASNFPTFMQLKIIFHTSIQFLISEDWNFEVCMEAYKFFGPVCPTCNPRTIHKRTPLFHSMEKHILSKHEKLIT